MTENLQSTVLKILSINTR